MNVRRRICLAEMCTSCYNFLLGGAKLITFQMFAPSGSAAKSHGLNTSAPMRRGANLQISQMMPKNTATEISMVRMILRMSFFL